MKYQKICKVFPMSWRVVRAAGIKNSKRSIICWIAMMLALSPCALAQKGDWKAVEQLKPGSHVVVKMDARKISCEVEDVTDTELFCEAYAPWFRDKRQLRIARAQIEEVRKMPHPNQGKDAAVGAAIGGGAGALSAGLTAPNYPGFHAVVGGAAGAGCGALVGAMVPVFQLALQHPKVIYRR